MSVKILNDKQKSSVVAGRKHGQTLKSLADKFNVSPDTIARVIKEAEIASATRTTGAVNIVVKPILVPAPVKIEAKIAEPEPVWNASSKFISITVGRKTYNADKDHPGFQKALELAVAGKVLEALDIINVEQAVTRFVDGDIRIEDGVLYFKDLELKTGLTQRIIDLMYAGKDFKFLLPFLHNLMLNPSRKAVYRLFDFLEANDIEITKEGYFIAWKKVRGDFKDIYTGKMSNRPGLEVRVERNQVDERDDVTCSHGLHVCSKSYLGHYGTSGGNKVVSVLVHPKDVVSIPVDYNNAKMRTSGYKVLADVTGKF